MWRWGVSSNCLFPRKLWLWVKSEMYSQNMHDVKTTTRILYYIQHSTNPLEQFQEQCYLTWTVQHHAFKHNRHSNTNPDLEATVANSARHHWIIGMYNQGGSLVQHASVGPRYHGCVVCVLLKALGLEVGGDGRVLAPLLLILVVVR